MSVRLTDTVWTEGPLSRAQCFGRGLLIAQVALSMTLLVGAGLFTATLAHLRAIDTSLQSQRIVFTRAFREPGDRQILPLDYYRTLVTGLANMPGADAAALSVYYPMYFAAAGPLPTDYHYTQAGGRRFAYRYTSSRALSTKYPGTTVIP